MGCYPNYNKNMIVDNQNPQRTNAAIKAIFDCVGIIPTQQRLQIARVMLSRPQHLSADQLLALVNQSGANVSKATVYNTLGLFAHKGLVREVLVDPDRVFFDSNTNPHFHLYNEDTGALSDFSAKHLLPTPPELPAGTTLVDIDVIVRIRNSRASSE